MRFLLVSLSLAVIRQTGAINFPFESVQLTEKDVQSFAQIAFATDRNGSTEPCKAFPGTNSWPMTASWAQLNTSLSGALLQPAIPASACYDGPQKDTEKCNYLLSRASSSRFYLDDPITVLTEWPTGDTCPTSSRPTGSCTRGGFASYVVDATNVKQIQATVNFARNQNIRLVMKNSGHDFVGRNTGAGSISIWLHHLKSFEFLPNYVQGGYNGPAARVGTGLEAWELFKHMKTYNMSIVVPAGSTTVAPWGGWMAGGGHSILASKYGLGADQVLSLQVVTADGSFVTANTETNQDLFFALRGGGPSTYGIVTSAIVKTYPALEVSNVPLSFSGGTSSIPIETFWAGVDKYHLIGKNVTDVGGSAYSYISSSNNGRSATFSTTFELPGMTKQQGFAYMQTHFDALNKIGIPVKNTMPNSSPSWTNTRDGVGDAPGGSTQFSSRLFPVKNFDDPALFKPTMTAIRQSVEAGYTFHGIHLRPSLDKAGYPGTAAVIPAWRNTVMHADSFNGFNMRGKTAAQIADAHAKHNIYMDRIRAVTPGGGAYINEADVQEPNWQDSFFGGTYQRLAKIKKDVDPWNLFWAPSTVGSEAYAVVTEDGKFTQNGPLCRT